VEKGRTTGKIAGAVSILMLAGCMGSGEGDDVVSRAPFNLLKSPLTKSDKPLDPVPAETSAIIQELQTRQTVLKSGSTYDQIAKAVLGANARTAEAELRTAKLRAEAASKNWLPTLGPTLSLNSLGSVIATMFVEQVLFDNGKKKAERAFAKADVEVAAVNLASDTNSRVMTGLELYLTAAKARATAKIANSASAQMADFEYIMGERVRGGVSNRADLQIIQQKRAEVQSKLANDREIEAAAMAELSAMSTLPVGDKRGLSSINQPSSETKALIVVLAEAEKERSLAEATIARAGYLPSAVLSGGVGTGGNNLGVQVASDNGLGFGMGASLKAIEAEKETATRRVNQAQEDANRSLNSKRQTLGSLKRKQGQLKDVFLQASNNLALFEEQYKAGQRPVMDVIGVYETKVRTEREYAAVAYDIALMELKIANELGVLVSGDQI